MLLAGRIGAGLQHFKSQSIWGTQLFTSVGGELTHLVHLAVIRIFERYSEDLVLVEGALERNISE